MNKDPIIWAMLNAMKEQQQEIADLGKRTAKLDSTVNHLTQYRTKTSIVSTRIPQ